MKINIGKSTVSFFGLEGEEQDYFQDLFSFNKVDMEIGIQYLGLFLKKNNYLKQDWK